MQFRRSCSTLHQYLLCLTQLLTIREVPNLVPVESYCCLRLWLLRLSLSTLRLFQECTQHQHSVVEHVALAPGMIAAPALRCRVPCACNIFVSSVRLLNTTSDNKVVSHPKRENFIPNPKTTFIQKPVSSQNDFYVRTTANKTTRWWQNNIVRVCVKASPAGGRPKAGDALHKHGLMPASRVSTGLHVEHRRKAGDASHEGLLKVERREFRCFRV